MQTLCELRSGVLAKVFLHLRETDPSTLQEMEYFLVERSTVTACVKDEAQGIRIFCNSGCAQDLISIGSKIAKALIYGAMPSVSFLEICVRDWDRTFTWKRKNFTCETELALPIEALIDAEKIFAAMLANKDSGAAIISLDQRVRLFTHTVNQFPPDNLRQAPPPWLWIGYDVSTLWGKREYLLEMLQRLNAEKSLRDYGVVGYEAIWDKKHNAIRPGALRAWSCDFHLIGPENCLGEPAILSIFKTAEPITRF